MKRILLIAAMVACPAMAEDNRQLAKLLPPAQEVLREEMLDNLLAVNEILSLLAENKVVEAGELAEKRLGRSAMGRHAKRPFEERPGPQMPVAMHDIGREGHQAASEFARAAASGDRIQALAKLPGLMGSCVACHMSYRTR